MSISLNMLELKGMELQALLNELDDIFPPATPNPSDTITHIMYRAGQRSVVEWIEQRLSQD